MREKPSPNQRKEEEANAWCNKRLAQSCKCSHLAGHCNHLTSAEQALIRGALPPPPFWGSKVSIHQAQWLCNSFMQAITFVISVIALIISIMALVHTLGRK